MKPKLERLWNANYLKVWGANFIVNFSFMLLMPLLPLYLSDTFAADKETIGIVLSGYTITTLLIRPFSGFIVDSFDRKTVLLISFIVFAAMFGGYLVAGTLIAFAIVRTLHGFPFGVVTVANSTVAIDVLPSSRRAEGIGYYGLSNNISTAISPTIALWIFAFTQSYESLFLLSLVIASAGIWMCLTLKLKPREPIAGKEKVSFDRFILTKGWSEGLCIVCYACSYGIVSTYVALYGQEVLGISGGTGFFFLFLAIGLVLSRLTGSRSLRKGRIVHNATIGTTVALVGFLLFAACPNPVGYYLAPFIIGLGNGHMYPAFLNMMIDLAPNNHRGTANSTILISWDIGIGLGVLIGGIVSEYHGFSAAFFTGALVNLAGVIFYHLYSKSHFLRNKLR